MALPGIRPQADPVCQRLRRRLSPQRRSKRRPQHQLRSKQPRQRRLDQLNRCLGTR